MEEKILFFIFCHYVVFIVGRQNKNRGFSGGSFLKKVGIFKNPQDISGAAGAFAPPGAGPESSAGAKAPPGAGSESLAGAKAPPGAGPESLAGAKAPPGAGSSKKCRGEAPPGAGSDI